jgi:DNA-binding transcriptional regulator YhcF (GntR family)
MSSSAQIRIDVDSQVPAYRQIVDQLRVLIVEGVLAPGQTLPPVRRLAMELNVHFNTVAEAYRMLAQEGLLETAHGRAARVLEAHAEITAHQEQREALQLLRERLRQLAAELRTKGLSPVQIARELRGFAKELE